MAGVIKNVIKVAGMKDRVIASDFLVSAKAGVIYTSLALTESATPELRRELENQLFQALDTHEAISQYMIENGYYHPHLPSEQLKVDMETSETSTELAEK